MLFTIKEVASVAHQMGKRAFVEAYGGAGFDSTFEYYKRMGDWLIVHGINSVDQHLSYGTVRGARKRDYPQSFSDVAEWWANYRPHGEHLHRLSYALSQGVARNRVLVIPATTSGFLAARRHGPQTELENLRRANALLTQFLADHQVDYDFGDEYILEWLGDAQQRKLKVGQASYDLIVLPEQMTNLRRQTVTLLDAYLQAGGEIVSLGPAPQYVDGRASDLVADLFRRHAARVRVVENRESLLSEIQRRLPPLMEFDRELPKGVGLLQRHLADGTRLAMFNNAGPAAVRARVKTDGGAVEIWDALTGTTSEGVFAAAGKGKVAFDLDLAPAGSALLLIKQSGRSARPAPEPLATAIPAPNWTVEVESPNVLAIDYCDLKVNGAVYKSINALRANQRIWRGHGFEKPAWDNAVQFHNHVFDRNKFGPESGFTATFRFRVDDAVALQGMELAVEAPELYRVTVNGQAVDFGAAKPWLDQHLRSVSIERFAKTGDNVVEIVANPFDVRMELENVYIRGRFTVAADGPGFSISAPATLNLGSWAKQGYPFYGGSVRYSAAVDVPAGHDSIKVDLENWHGSMAEILLDGKPAALLQWPPYRAVISAGPGRHTVAVRVVSTPRNQFGPFHNPGKPRFTSSDSHHREFPEHQPSGSQYDFIDYGLNTTPRLAAVA
ncbi:MAG TPA: glycosyl hydrolase, partial [Bryobacteraceae bacterium]|nr:glycosyl hydrolase [Bryobacteraceae bacterium]